VANPQAKLESPISPAISSVVERNDAAPQRESLHDTLVDSIYFGYESLKTTIRKQVYNEKDLDLPVLDAFKTKPAEAIKVSTNGSSERGIDRHLEINSGGRERDYILHVPKNYDPSKPMPLVVVLHGLGQDADRISSLSKMSEKADKEGFIVAYPNGTKWLGQLRSWDADNGVQLPGTDSNDVGFVKDMVKTIKENMNVDKDKVYAAGFSNGGMLAYRLASEMSDTFSRWQVVSSGSSGAEAKPSEAVSIMSIHGTSDRVVPLEGRAPGQGLSTLGVPRFQSFGESYKTWAKHLGISHAPLIERDGDRITSRSVNPETGAEVIAVVVKDGGHEWPGSDRAKAANPNSPEANYPTTDKIWEFFKSHKKNSSQPVQCDDRALVA